MGPTEANPRESMQRGRPARPRPAMQGNKDGPGRATLEYHRRCRRETREARRASGLKRCQKRGVAEKVVAVANAAPRLPGRRRGCGAAHATVVLGCSTRVRECRQF
jgi:hypothetical protein